MFSFGSGMDEQMDRLEIRSYKWKKKTLYYEFTLDKTLLTNYLKSLTWFPLHRMVCYDGFSQFGKPSKTSKPL